MDYTVLIERAEDGSFSAYVPDLPGCVSCGDTAGEAIDSIQEAIRGHLATMRQYGESIPSPKSFATVIHAG